MFPCAAENGIGFQRLICKNNSCKHLLKTIVFIEGWETRVAGEMLHKSNGSSYYECPKCKAHNFIILEGEEIILEKIVSYAMPKHELQQKGLQKYQVAIDSVIRKT
jgi:Zn finger protein HypA/HybF involved in hydrogenase expression